MRIIFAALALMMLSYAQEPGRIYVYAQRLTAARSWLPIAIDKTTVAKIKRGTFFAVTMVPGRHTVTVENGIPAFIEVGSGEERYVRLDWNMHVGRPPIPALSVVREDQARNEMRFLSYIAAGKIVSTSVSRTDPREPEAPRLKRRDQPDDGAEPSAR